jgi:hypothetical protein
VGGRELAEAPRATPVGLLRLISLMNCRMPELPAEANREATARYLDILIDGPRA